MRHSRIAFAVAALAAMTLALPAEAGNRFSGSTTTANGDLTAGSAQVLNPFFHKPAFETISWGADATGSGLVHADAAQADTPNPWRRASSTHPTGVGQPWPPSVSSRGPREDTSKTG